MSTICSTCDCNKHYYYYYCACFPWFLSFGNRTQNSRVSGARPNHQADRGSDPNHRGIWSPPMAGLEYTGRYRFPEILIEVRAAFLELPNVRRMFAKSEEKTSHRFGIVVLKTGLSVSRPGVEWVLEIRISTNCDCGQKNVKRQFFAIFESGKIVFRNSITLPVSYFPIPTAKMIVNI